VLVRDELTRRCLLLAIRLGLRRGCLRTGQCSPPFLVV
jgi:hypothetical protein